MNLLWGPLNQFSTHNFPDTYSPIMKLLHDADPELPQQGEPSMPTLQDMHKTCAASPASSSSFWLLRMELAYRHFYGMGAVRIGRHRLAWNLHVREDHLATSGTVGLTGLG